MLKEKGDEITKVRLDVVVREAIIEAFEEILEEDDGDTIIHTFEGEGYTVKQMLEEVKERTIAGRDYIKHEVVAWVKSSL